LEWQWKSRYRFRIPSLLRPGLLPPKTGTGTRETRAATVAAMVLETFLMPISGEWSWKPLDVSRRIRKNALEDGLNGRMRRMERAKDLPIEETNQNLKRKKKKKSQICQGTEIVLRKGEKIKIQIMSPQIWALFMLLHHLELLI
jgi:hypothetical protein